MSIKSLFIAVLAISFVQCKSVAQTTTVVETPAKESIHKFAPLPYSYDALEPYIDKMTMEIHYSRHHQAYYNNFMAAIKGTDLESTPMIDIFAQMSTHSVAIKNNGGGYWNHEFFWNLMIPGGSKVPTGALAKAIDQTYGTFDEFKKQFADAGAKRFGSGWAWLSVAQDGKLFISSTANQDNPLMNTETLRGTPVLAIDVWEHAYYLKYQNKRADYLAAFWNVVNWDVVATQYEMALKK
jgi:superoxide dismutase, Fe-Mn family